MPSKKKQTVSAIKNTEVVEQEAYQIWISTVGLDDIFIHEVSFKRVGTIKARNLAINFDVKSINVNIHDEGFTMIAFAEATMGSGDADEQMDIFGDLKISYVLEYSYNGASKNREFIEQYTQRNGMLHVWPYFRNFLSRFTSDIGLPPYTLETLPPISINH